MWILIAAADLEPSVDCCALAGKLPDDNRRRRSSNQAAVENSLPVPINAAADPDDVARQNGAWLVQCGLQIPRIIDASVSVRRALRRDIMLTGGCTDHQRNGDSGRRSTCARRA